MPTAYAATNTGIVLYGDGTTAVPKYRTWDGTNFSAQSSAGTTVANVNYLVVKEATTRNEKVLGSLASTGGIHFQVWASSAWGNIINPGAIGITNAAERGFDIAYEQLSGNAIVVYEKNTTSDKAVYYQIWSGSSWGGEQTLTYSSGINGNILWVRLESKPNTNEIMLVTEDSNSDINAIVWNGSAWVNEQLLTSSASIATSDPFDVAYENSSGDALVVYGDGTAIDFWTYISGIWTDGTGGGALCTETGTAAACVTPAAAVHQLNLAPGRNNDYISAIYIDAGTDITAQIWNGTGWLGLPSAQATWDEAAAELPSATIRSRTVGNAFEVTGNRFMFVFSDLGLLLIDYFFFDVDSLSWFTGDGTTALTDIDNVTTQTPTWSDDVEVIQLDSNPQDNSQIMITGSDLLKSTRSFLWGGSSWSTPTQSVHTIINLSVLNLGPFFFVWDLTNTPPATPTNSTPAGGATNQSPTPTLTSSAFSDADGDSHNASRWQVDNNSDFSSPTFDSGTDTTNKTSIAVSPALSSNTVYYWRVQYKDNSGKPNVWSSYSTATSFTTTNSPATPSNSSPTHASNVNTLSPTLTSSAFSDSDGDSHNASQWLVDNNSDFSSPTFDSGTDTTNKTSVVPTGLSWDTTYYWKVKHKDSLGAWSSYSSATTFNTVNLVPATPTNTIPPNGTAVFIFPTLVSSNFSDPNSGSHAASQWQVDDDVAFSSIAFDSGEDTANLLSIKVPTTVVRDKTYYWRVRHKDNSGASNPWSSYSTPTQFTLSDTAIDIKISGQGSYAPANSIELVAQLQDAATNAFVNDAALTINIYNPSKTIVVSAASMTYLTSSNGLYTYTYTAPSTLGGYIFDISAVASSTFAATPQRKGYNASTFLVASAAGGGGDSQNITDIKNALVGATGTADSGTTLTLVDNALTQANDFWNGMTLIITGGTNVGEIRQISDFDAATDKITVDAAFTLAIDTSSTYLIRREMNWAERVWNYSTRTLTSFGTLVADIWAYSSRLLTGKTLTGGGNLATEAYIDTATTTLTAEINENQTLISALNNISAADVWSYSSRSITNPDAIWEYALTQIGDTGSVGKLLKDNINATISSRSSHTAADVWGVVSRTLTSNANFNDPTSAQVASDVWAQSVRTLSSYGNDITAQNVWDVLSTNLTTAGSIGKRLADNVDATVSSRASLANQVAGWTVWLSDFDQVLAGNTYRTKLWVLNYASVPTDANSTPTVTLYDASRNTVVSNVAMTKITTGVYEYTYSVAAGAVQGVWETVASATVEVGKTIQANDYWEVEGSPAQVLINSVSDATVPSIAASVTITNEGSADYEYQYEWCVVSAENNACGGGDDVSYSSAAKFIQAGQDFNITLSATVSTVGAYWFKVVVYYGTEKSGASQTFTASPESAPTPTPSPASGGGGGSIIQPTILSSNSAFCTTFSAVCDILNAIFGRLISLTTSMVNLETRMSALEKKVSTVPLPAPQIIIERTITRPTILPAAELKKRIRLEVASQ